MKINILTLFPQMFEGPFNFSIVKKAINTKLVEINFVDIRNFGLGKHKIVDGKVFGGGSGMILRVDVIEKALNSIKEKDKNSKTIIMDARGEKFNQKTASEYASFDILNIICGHYEGFDERILNLVDQAISIGDFILTGGEIPAMLIVDSVTRLIPDVLKQGVTNSESFSLNLGNKKGLLEYPQYTLPRDFNGISVPEILVSGNHKKILEWRESKAIEKTQK